VGGISRVHWSTGMCRVPISVDPETGGLLFASSAAVVTVSGQINDTVLDGSVHFSVSINITNDSHTLGQNYKWFMYVH